jgi:hypothetical protein
MFFSSLKKSWYLEYVMWILHNLFSLKIAASNKNKKVKNDEAKFLGVIGTMS